MILRCTAKLLSLIGARPKDLTDPVDPSPEDEWYANLLWFERRKCLLVTHAATLFSVLAIDIKKADITPIGPFLIDRIHAELVSERLPLTTLGALNPANVVIARTASRRILGTMNDIAMNCEHHIRGAGGLAHADLTRHNHLLRGMPDAPGGYEHPIAMARERARRLLDP